MGLLWAGLLAAPVAWAVGFQAVYALTLNSCVGASRALLLLLNVACIAVGGVALWLSLRNLRQAGGWPTSQDEATVGRSRLMAAVGVLTAGLFMLAMIAQAIAVLFLDPCPW